MNSSGRKAKLIVLAGMMVFSLPACGKKDNAADEILIDPDYIVQEYETTTTDDGYTIINGFYRIKSKVVDAKDLILYIPYVEDKQAGVSYLEERYLESTTRNWREIEIRNTPDGATFDKQTSSKCEAAYEQACLEAGNIPDGALYNKQTSSDYGAPYVEASIVPDFALAYYNPNDTIPNWYLSDQSEYVFVYSEEKAGDGKSTSDTMVCLDVGAISVAMYEDFYDDIPKMNISVYGVPKTLFKKKFGKTFGPKEFLKYKDTLKKNDYKDCDLLCSKDITATGVYYVDYAELNKKGDYINYIIEYKFSDAGEKVYLKACAAGGYKINNEKVYSEWKKAHAEQMINN